MKKFGIVMLVFSAANLIAAILAFANDAAEAGGRKIDAFLLLAILGGILFFVGRKREKKQNEE